MTQELIDSLKGQARRIIEGLLFSSSEPLPLRKLKEILEPLHSFTLDEVAEVIEQLKQEYHDQGRAFQIEEIAQGYLMRTHQELGPYIQELIRNGRQDRLSHAALEVLAIVAYRQPITRPQIEELRGVDSSGIVSTLIGRELIEPTGKLEVPGRPTLYTVTTHFLKHFGLRDLHDLPTLETSTQT